MPNTNTWKSIKREIRAEDTGDKNTPVPLFYAGTGGVCFPRGINRGPSAFRQGGYKKQGLKSLFETQLHGYLVLVRFTRMAEAEFFVKLSGRVVPFDVAEADPVVFSVLLHHFQYLFGGFIAKTPALIPLVDEKLAEIIGFFFVPIVIHSHADGQPQCGADCL